MKLQGEFFLQPTLKVAKELLGKYIVRKYKGKLIIGKIVETEAYIGPKDKASHAYSKKEQKIKEKLKVINENWKRIKNYVENKEKFIKRILSMKNNKVTKRNLAEYLKGGHIYIYLVYGNYYQLNITTFQEGYPECVLIRSLEPLPRMNADLARIYADHTRMNADMELINSDKEIRKNPFKNQHKSVVSRMNIDPKGPGRVCQYLKLYSSFWGEDLCQSKRIWLIDGEKINKNDIIKAKRVGIDYAGEDANLLWRFYLKNNQWVSKK